MECSGVYMLDTKEVDEFYTANYTKMLAYICNKKRGGDKVNLYPDAALEVLHDCYIYHKEHPEAFSSKYIWNLLKQRRISSLRDNGRYDSMKQDFFDNYYTNKVKTVDGLDVPIADKELLKLIHIEIAATLSSSAKSVLTRFFIKGETLRSASDRKTVERFKKRIVEKYGDVDV